MAERIEYSKRERNIPVELFESWQKLRRSDDARELVKFTGKSLPVIYAALNNGFVGKPELAEEITKYYLQRPAEIVKISQKAKQLIDRSQGEGQETSVTQG